VCQVQQHCIHDWSVCLQLLGSWNPTWWTLSGCLAAAAQNWTTFSLTFASTAASPQWACAADIESCRMPGVGIKSQATEGRTPSPAPRPDIESPSS